MDRIIEINREVNKLIRESQEIDFKCGFVVSFSNDGFQQINLVPKTEKDLQPVREIPPLNLE